jgi:hypothetical protein
VASTVLYQLNESFALLIPSPIGFPKHKKKIKKRKTKNETLGLPLSWSFLKMPDPSPFITRLCVIHARNCYNEQNWACAAAPMRNGTQASLWWRFFPKQLPSIPKKR